MWTLPRMRYADCSGSESSEETEVVVNIGGVKHVLPGHLLNRYPETFLAELAKNSFQSFDTVASLCDDYDPVKGEFYFDRDPDMFRCILELYFYGEIHMKRGMCPLSFVKEMEFWKIDPDLLDACCFGNLKEEEGELSEIADKVKLILDDLEEDSDATCWQRCQTFLWKLMEKPECSLPAHIVAILSFIFILLSSVVMCMGTIPELQLQDAEGNNMEHPVLDAIETACIVWFTVEYILRLVSSPNKVRFLLSIMNIIDFLAIIPFYVVQTLTHLGNSVLELSNVQQAVQALRIMRIARIFKLARHSSGLQTLTYALKKSLKELGLLLMYMGIGIFLFSAMGYTLEQSNPDTMFTSIPQSFWWAIITMTTVGYGDIYPKTTLGRCNAAVSFLCGVIAIALPIHPIINNFVICYNRQTMLHNSAKHEVELMALQSGTAQLGETSPKSLKPCGAVKLCDSAMRTSQSDAYIPLLEDNSPKAPLATSKDEDETNKSTN